MHFVHIDYPCCFGSISAVERLVIFPGIAQKVDPEEALDEEEEEVVAAAAVEEEIEPATIAVKLTTWHVNAQTKNSTTIMPRIAWIDQRPGVLNDYCN